MDHSGLESSYGSEVGDEHKFIAMSDGDNEGSALEEQRQYLFSVAVIRFGKP